MGPDRDGDATTAASGDLPIDYFSASPSIVSAAMEPVAPRSLGPSRRAISGTGAIAALLTVPVWLLAFPPEKSIDPLELGLRVGTLFAALSAYACFARCNARALEAGWFVFSYSVLLDLLRQFTAEPVSWGKWPVLATRAAALVLIAIGGARFVTRRPRGRAHLPPPPVVRPASDLHAEAR